MITGKQKGDFEKCTRKTEILIPKVLSQLFKISNCTKFNPPHLFTIFEGPQSKNKLRKKNIIPQREELQRNREGKHAMDNIELWKAFQAFFFYLLRNGLNKIISLKNCECHFLHISQIHFFRCTVAKVVHYVWVVSNIKMAQACAYLYEHPQSIMQTFEITVIINELLLNLQCFRAALRINRNYLGSHDLNSCFAHPEERTYCIKYFCSFIFPGY